MGNFFPDTFIMKFFFLEVIAQEWTTWRKVIWNTRFAFRGLFGGWPQYDKAICPQEALQRKVITYKCKVDTFFKKKVIDTVTSYFSRTFPKRRYVQKLRVSSFLATSDSSRDCNLRKRNVEEKIKTSFAHSKILCFFLQLLKILVVALAKCHFTLLFQSFLIFQ